MKDALVENRIADIVKFFDAPDSISRQSARITQVKKSKAMGNAKLAVVVITICALASIYGIADVFGGKKLPMGVLFLIGGPIGVVIGIKMVFSALGRAATASQVTFETDLVKLCKAFYSNVFCKKVTDLVSKNDQIVDVCQFIPVPVVENYRKSGWDTFIPKGKARAAGLTGSKTRSWGQPIECVRCRKKCEQSEDCGAPISVARRLREEQRHELPVETQNLISMLYLKCQYCGTVVCYECVAYSSPQELRFFCPTCGKATNGWDDLAERWMNLRRSKTHQDLDFSLSSVEVDQSPRSDRRIVDVVVHLNGSPFGTLSLSNVAFNIDGKWFLATPEPLVC